MAAIHLGDGFPTAAPGKTGEDYDRCPYDGCLEVDRAHGLGGRDGRGHEYRLWSIYNADQRAGGCGRSWSRTTAQGRVRDQQAGRDPHWLTRSAQREQAVSMPSERFRRNYSLIDWSK